MEKLAGQHPPLACRPSPPQGGDWQPSPAAPLLQRGRLAKPVKRLISPLAGEMPGRAEGGAVP
ncbi:MAG: hypothetical protein E5X75_33520, partial [Mesorhizobium sp.]